MRQFQIIQSVCLLIASLTLSGCGYYWSDNAGTGAAPDPDFAWRGLYRQDVKTVAVPIFTNRTYYRGVEFSLTKAVINQLESRTPYKVVPKEQADTILEGQIIDVEVHTQNRSQTAGIPQEQLYVIIVNFTWKDLRTGQILVTRHNFGQTAPYYPTLGEDQFAGSQENIERLGLAVVEELQAEWGNTKTSATKPAATP
jgi:hypothetical protein